MSELERETTSRLRSIRESHERLLLEGGPVRGGVGCLAIATGSALYLRSSLPRTGR
jgi:hypothetical protein